MLFTVFLMSSTKRKFSNNLDMSLQVGNWVIKKRIHVHMEHVQPSRCTKDYCLRKLKNDELKVVEKAKGEVISTKRQPKGPKPGFMVEVATLETTMLSMILRVVTRPFLLSLSYLDLCFFVSFITLGKVLRFYACSMLY